ncbi:MAG: toprim domain-containing protein [Candidatus Odinarchaeum yellowstonii]|uniref:Toprim domain-containing protein n=1 Tax=Odinarchaeota yellowstonii (strain LCB_4) TaxID=1841599 RepID=A0AAF0IBR4_ODILC|nr:MAG: toprim domain-containing protein [Candidatus Odinarchaeum yellowstonii]
MEIDLKRLRLLLEELDVTSYSTPIIVEGRKDAESLRKIGITGLIHSISGRSISEVVEELKAYREVIILTDYDSEGFKIKNKLVKDFQTAGVKVNLRYYKLLKSVLKGFIIQIEGLFKFLSSKGYWDEST